MRAVFVVLILLAAAGNARASTEIEDAVSPDKKWVLTMKPGEFHCKVFLKNSAKSKALTTFDIDEFAADDVRDTITAHWRNDSAAVALNIAKGRNITDCEILVFTNGQWKRLAWPENELKAVRERNNEEAGKSQDYLTFDSWLPDGVKINYQGNTGTVEDLDFRILSGAKPHLTLMAIADYTHAIDLDPQCARCYYDRGNAYFEKKEYAKAVKDVENAIEIDPKNSDYYFQLGWYQLFNRKPREAIAASLKALDLWPGDLEAATVKINLAHGYLFDNQFDKAKTIYLENKDYKQAVLDDFKKLEKAGITHPDIKKIKAHLTSEAQDTNSTDSH